MGPATLEPAVAKKQRPSETIRVDAETAEAIRLAAAMKKLSIMDWLRAVVLPAANRDIKAEAKKLAKGDAE